jgi:prophage regulatory protein
MANLVHLRIQRITETLKSTGYKKSTFYNRINAGLMPPPVSLAGGRSVGWIEHEIQSVIAAFCAGKSPEEIKELVKELIVQRSELI